MKDISTQLQDLGSQLQQLRRQKGLTLEEVGKLSDISAGFLSQLERGLANPSYVTLSKIANGLDVPIGAFFQATDTSDPVVRKDRRRKIVLEGANLVYELLAPDLSRSIEFLLTEFAPGVSTEDYPSRHEGEECALVLEGTLEIHWRDQVYVLGEGDSICLPCNVPHWYHNPGKKKVVCVWAVSPPSF